MVATSYFMYLYTVETYTKNINGIADIHIQENVHNKIATYYYNKIR